MRFSWKRWRLAAVAALTALAVSVALAGPAFAAEPGESGNWQNEWADQDVTTQGTMSEAYNGREHLDAWRGDTNNIVWMSLDNGSPFNLPNPDGTRTATYVSPTVVPYGQSSWMVLHTGVDNNIYYAIFNNNYTWSGSWTAVPYQSTTMTVSVTQLGSGSNQLYMVYRSSIDDRIWGTFYDGYGWQGAQNIGEGNSPAAPSVTYNAVTGRLYAVARGEDNQVWMASSYDNHGNSWGSWQGQGGSTFVQPTIAATASGNMLVSYVDEYSHSPFYRSYNQYGSPNGDWSQDITGWETSYAVALSVIGYTVFAVLTGGGDYAYWKQAYNG